MPSVFSRIISGEFPGSFVWRDDLCVAFLSINPIAHGHVLVVPIEEVDHWDDCSESLVNHLFGVSRTIARAQRRTFDCERVGLIVAGFEVAHAHIHLIPSMSMRELSFENAAHSVDRDELNSAAHSIRSALANTATPPSS